MLLRKKIVLLGMVLLMSSCSSINNQLANFYTKQNKQYLQSKTEQPLQIPPGLSSKRIDERYVIPSLPRSTPVSTPTIVPPGSHLSNLQADLPVAKNAIVLQKNERGQDILLLQSDMQKSWEIVGRALPLAGYHMLKPQQQTQSYLLLTSKRVLRKTENQIYQVHLEALQNYTAISVLDVASQPAATPVSRRILQRLAKTVKKLQLGA